ncbi:hypothetical protein BDR26DRAFT_916670 [Obelidium mucronatum]|nr:hypothetical protein BDR26DRAFT_916670 [Obelidium mucronatum]
MLFETTLLPFLLCLATKAQGAVVEPKCDASALNNMVIFDPPVLSYDSSKVGTSFKVSLASAVNGTFQASFSLDGYKFDQSSVTFTQENWSKPQTIVVVANSDCVASGVAKLKMKFNINAPCLETVHQCSGIYQVNHSTAKALSCSITGDPHISTFDQSSISYQGVGGFYYVKSEFFEVQGYQYPCSLFSTVSCVGAVSIRYGDSVLMLSGMEKPSLFGFNHEGASLTLLSKTMAGIEYTPKDITRAKSFTLTTQCGSVVTITWNSLPFMSVEIQLAPFYKGIVQGQCAESGNRLSNNWAIPLENYHMKNRYIPGPFPLAGLWGTGITKTLVVGKLITQFDSVCNVATVATTTVAPLPTATPVIPPYDPNDHVVITPVTKTTTASPTATTATAILVGTTTNAATSAFSTTEQPSTQPTENQTSTRTFQTIPSVSKSNSVDVTTAISSSSKPESSATTSSATTVNVATTAMATTSGTGNPPYTPPSPVYTEADHKTAIDQCTAVIAGEAGCADLTDNRIQFIINACAKDVLAAGNHDFTEGHKRAAHSSCCQVATTIIQSPVQIENATVAATAVIVANGYGNNTCPNNCSGRGSCGDLGCACIAGFSGVDCSVNLGTLVPPSPQQGGCSPPVALAENPIVKAISQNPVSYPANPIVSAPVASGAVPPAANVGNSMPKPANVTSTKTVNNLVSSDSAIGASVFVYFAIVSFL